MDEGGETMHIITVTIYTKSRVADSFFFCLVDLDPVSTIFRSIGCHVLMQKMVSRLSQRGKKKSTCTT